MAGYSIYLLFLVLSVVLLYSVTLIAFSFYQNKNDKSLVLFLALVVFTLISLYACLTTNAKTITWFWIIFITIRLIIRRDDFRIPELRASKMMVYPKIFIRLLFYSAASFFFCHWFFRYHLNFNGVLFETHNDIVSYARMATHLNNFGFENRNLDHLMGINTFNELYHYGDLWSIALVAKLFGIKTILAEIYIIIPIFMALVFLLLTNLVFRNKTTGYLTLMILGLWFLFSSILPFKTQINLIDNSIFLFAPLVFTAKIYLIFIILLVFFSADVNVLGNQLFLLVGIGSFYTPVLIPISMFLVFINLYNNPNKIFSTPFLLSKLLLPISMVLSFSLFYTFFSDKNGNSFFEGKSLLMDYLLSKQYWINFIRNFKFFMIGIITTTIFVGIILLLFIRRSFKEFAMQALRRAQSSKMFRYVILLNLSGYISYNVLNVFFDSGQLFQLLQLIIYCLVLSVFFASLLTYLSRIKKILLLLFLLMISYFQNQYLIKNGTIGTVIADTEFYEKIKNVTDNDNGNGFVFIRDSSLLNTPWKKIVSFEIPAFDLVYYFKDYNPICISVMNIKYSTSNTHEVVERANIRNNSFYRYYTKHQLTDVELAQKQFISEYNCCYVFIDATLPIPTYLSENAICQFNSKTLNLNFLKIDLTKL